MGVCAINFFYLKKKLMFICAARGEEIENIV